MSTTAKKATSFRPIWGNPGEDEQTCEHRFGSTEECAKYAEKRRKQANATLCGAVESEDPVNARWNEEAGDAELFATT